MGRPQQRELKAKEALPLKNTDTYTSYPSGGGGWGDPLDRDPEWVRMDTRNEIISTDSARNIYGVVLKGDRLEINTEQTFKLRVKIKRER